MVPTRIDFDSPREPALPSSRIKVRALGQVLEQSVANFKEVAVELDELHEELAKYKTHYTELKEKCDRYKCDGCESLLKIIKSEDVIDCIVPILRKLHETDSLSIPSEVLRIVCEVPTFMTPPSESKNDDDLEFIRAEESAAIKQEANESIQDISFREDSTSEIEGTPTGRTSPIIPSRKFRINVCSSSPDCKDKVKCPASWSTPPKKSLKLTFNPIPKPRCKEKSKAKFRQLRLMPSKQNKVLDLSESVAETGGVRNSKPDFSDKQLTVKNEPVDSDDTIMPSPTSGIRIPVLCKSGSNNSPIKFKKPLTCKLKVENNNQNEKKLENKPSLDVEITKMEESINMKGTYTLKSIDMNQSPLKKENQCIIDNDVTNCEGDYSISLLQNINKLEQNNMPVQMKSSPAKRPLTENININNVEMESSLSILHKNMMGTRSTEINDKRKVIEEYNLCKETIPRKKAEKMALPGWSCDECKNFYAELYKDNIEMLALKMNECSKHRGLRNPIRPATPTGFWNVRWDVPKDTEEFNRRNDAI